METPSVAAAVWLMAAFDPILIVRAFDEQVPQETATRVGLEMALWDAFGQQTGQPIHALLGGALRKRLRLYANINRHVRERTPAGFATAAAQAADQGFGAIKLAPFDELNQP